MISTTSFFTFLVAALALNLAPGPDMLYVLGRSLGQGRKAGVVSSLGIFAGCLVHIAAAALGLAAILRSYPLAFNAVRYAGAAYLVYLGIRTILAKRSSLESSSVPRADRFDRIFYQGVITNVLNPKVAMFFLAFLPQFITPASASSISLSGVINSVGARILFLGFIFNVGGTSVNLLVASFAGYFGDRLRRAPRVARLQQWITGSVFVGLGVRLGLSRR